MRTLRLAAALTTGALLIGGAGVANAADTVVTVTQADNPGGAWFTADTRSPGTGIFESGPGTPPFGSGSFELSTPSAPAKVQLFTNAYDGVRLADIDGIGYSTWQDGIGAGSVAMVGLNMRVALDGGAAPNAYVVYEPYVDPLGNPISRGQWQTWDAYRGGAAKWWINIVAPSSPCGQGNPCTWNDMLAQYPNATIREASSCGPGGAPKSPCPGSLGLNQGSNNPGAHSNADGLWVSVNGNKTTYDFELGDTTKPTCGQMVVRRGGGPGGEDEADVTVSDSGSGIASITNFTVSNGTFFIPPFTPGASSVTVTARKTDQTQLTRFEFDVTDMAGNTIHCR
jgi:hypothetical protein